MAAATGTSTFRKIQAPSAAAPPAAMSAAVAAAAQQQQQQQQQQGKFPAGYATKLPAPVPVPMPLGVATPSCPRGLSSNLPVSSAHGHSQSHSHGAAVLNGALSTNGTATAGGVVVATVANSSSANSRGGPQQPYAPRLASPPPMLAPGAAAAAAAAAASTHQAPTVNNSNNNNNSTHTASWRTPRAHEVTSTRAPNLATWAPTGVAPQASSSNGTLGISGATAAAFQPGDLVEARWGKHDTWFPAIIASHNGDGTFLINWQDGNTHGRTKAATDIRRRSALTGSAAAASHSSEAMSARVQAPASASASAHLSQAGPGLWSPVTGPRLSGQAKGSGGIGPMIVCASGAASPSQASPGSAMGLQRSAAWLSSSTNSLKQQSQPPPPQQSAATVAAARSTEARLAAATAATSTTTANTTTAIAAAAAAAAAAGRPSPPSQASARAAFVQTRSMPTEASTSVVTTASLQRMVTSGGGSSQGVGQFSTQSPNGRTVVRFVQSGTASPQLPLLSAVSSGGMAASASASASPPGGSPCGAGSASFIVAPVLSPRLRPTASAGMSASAVRPPGVASISGSLGANNGSAAFAASGASATILSPRPAASCALGVHITTPEEDPLLVTVSPGAIGPGGGGGCSVATILPDPKGAEGGRHATANEDVEVEAVCTDPPRGMPSAPLAPAPASAPCQGGGGGGGGGGGDPRPPRLAADVLEQQQQRLAAAAAAAGLGEGGASVLSGPAPDEVQTLSAQSSARSTVPTAPPSPSAMRGLISCPQDDNSSPSMPRPRYPTGGFYDRSAGPAKESAKQLHERLLQEQEPEWERERRRRQQQHQQEDDAAAARMQAAASAPAPFTQEISGCAPSMSSTASAFTAPAGGARSVKCFKLELANGQRCVVVERPTDGKRWRFEQSSIEFELACDAKSLDRWLEGMCDDMLPGLLTLLGSEVSELGSSLKDLEKERDSLKGSEDYEFFGLNGEDCSDRDVERAYRKFSSRLHPDKGGDDQQFSDMRDRYEKLKALRGDEKGGSGSSGKGGGSIKWDPSSRDSMLRAHSELREQLVWITQLSKEVKEHTEELRKRQQAKPALPLKS